MGQTFPPVAVLALALAVPLIGFGEQPAYVALALYGLLPMLQGVMAGPDATPEAARDAARGLGLSARQTFWSVELPLAAPIIVDLSGFNTAYVVQGALLTGWLAITVDALFDQLARRSQRWKAGSAG